MKILEYEAKLILSKYGIPVPKGILATNVVEAREVAQKLRPPFAVKAQVPVSGRGKAGGILFAESIKDIEKAAEELFNRKIKGAPVRKILVEERIDILKELYLGMSIERLEKTYVIVGSTKGGIDVEEIAKESPHKVFRFSIDPFYGFQFYHAKQFVKRMGYSGNRLLLLANILYSLYRAGIDLDAELIEINPLAETREGDFIAVDARIIIDDNALFRHPEYRNKIFEEDLSPQEIEAIKNGLAYVKLDGDIGVIGNGAGLTMATLDLIQFYGGKPANFLDVGGGAPAEKIATAIRIVLSDSDVKALLVNILGGITRCDEVARGIIQAIRGLNEKKPIVVRLLGTNEEEGRQILTEAGIHVLDNMEVAAQKVVEVAREGKWG